MTKIFIDSDIILDVLIKREHYIHAAMLMTDLMNKKFLGYTSPIVISNIHYIMSKYENSKKSIQNIKKLRILLSILPVDESTIDEALNLNFKDFEAAIQYVAAKKNNMDFIITRNKNDYKNSKITVFDAVPRQKKFPNLSQTCRYSFP